MKQNLGNGQSSIDVPQNLTAEEKSALASIEQDIKNGKSDQEIQQKLTSFKEKVASRVDSENKFQQITFYGVNKGFKEQTIILHILNQGRLGKKINASEIIPHPINNIDQEVIDTMFEMAQKGANLLDIRNKVRLIFSGTPGKVIKQNSSDNMSKKVSENSNFSSGNYNNITTDEISNQPQLYRAVSSAPVQSSRLQESYVPNTNTIQQTRQQNNSGQKTQPQYSRVVDPQEQTVNQQESYVPNTNAIQQTRQQNNSGPKTQPNITANNTQIQNQSSNQSQPQYSRVVDPQEQTVNQQESYVPNTNAIQQTRQQNNYSPKTQPNTTANNTQIQNQSSNQSQPQYSRVVDPQEQTVNQQESYVPNTNAIQQTRQQNNSGPKIQPNITTNNNTNLDGLMTVMDIKNKKYYDIDRNSFMTIAKHSYMSEEPVAGRNIKPIDGKAADLLSLLR